MSKRKPHSNSPDEDAAAFLEAMEDVKRLEQDRREPFHRRPRPVPLEHDEGQDDDEPFVDRPIETGDELHFVRPGVQKRVFHDLRRGRIAPEACLDLHGLRVGEAREALQRFLTYASERRLRCVRIIHGKGGRSGQPVLKQKVDQWLPQRRQVLALCSAPSWDGGTGAAYVLLARRRP